MPVINMPAIKVKEFTTFPPCSIGGQNENILFLVNMVVTRIVNVFLFKQIKFITLLTTLHIKLLS